MLNLTTLRTLAEQEDEMAQLGRSAEQQALHEALWNLGRPERGFLTTGQAADRLQVSIPTIKRWVERGALAGGQLGGRWLVAAESVERLVGLRDALIELDREGNPNAAEMRTMHERTVPSAERNRDPASRA